MIIAIASISNSIKKSKAFQKNIFSLSKHYLLMPQTLLICL